MGKVIGRRLGEAFEGRSEHDDSGEASLHEAFDAVAVAAVLSAIAAGSGEAADMASAAIHALDDGDPGAGQLARDASAKAVEEAGGHQAPSLDRLHMTFRVEIAIETRPHNQWVRAFSVKATPS
jgi:hypothetical protein